MKTFILLNADAATDTQRADSVDAIIKNQEGNAENQRAEPKINFWFYGAAQLRDAFFAPLPAGEKGEAQLWIHTSIFDDNAALLDWLRQIDASWLQHTQVVFYSGGGLEDWEADLLLEHFQQLGVPAIRFLPPFPAGPASPGYEQLQLMVRSLATGIDLLRRQQSAEAFLDHLTCLGPAEPGILGEAFDALCGLYALSQQDLLRAQWQNFCAVRDNASLRELQDRLSALS